jgi:PEGA domain
MNHSRLSSRFALMIALGLAVFTSPASAADPSDNSRAVEASKHFGHGVKLSEDGDWRAAVIEFERAYAIAPSYRVLFDIGQCRYQLRDYPGALTAFQKYLAEGGDLVGADRRAQVVADIDLLRGRVATLRVGSTTPGAQVTLDEVSLGTTPLSAPIAVGTGRHKLVASKAGFADVQRTFDIAGGETLDVEVDLDPTRSEPVRTSKATSLAPALASFGVAVAGVAVGSVFGLMALGKKSDLDRTCDGKACPASSQSIYNDAQTDGLVSTIGWGAAIVGAGVGAAFLVIMAPKGSEAATAEPRVQLFVGPGWLGTKGTF